MGRVRTVLIIKGSDLALEGHDTWGPGWDARRQLSRLIVSTFECGPNHENVEVIPVSDVGVRQILQSGFIIRYPGGLTRDSQE